MMFYIFYSYTRQVKGFSFPPMSGMSQPAHLRKETLKKIKIKEKCQQLKLSLLSLLRSYYIDYRVSFAVSQKLSILFFYIFCFLCFIFFSKETEKSLRHFNLGESNNNNNNNYQYDRRLFHEKLYLE